MNSRIAPTDENLLLKARCSELELMLAQQSELINDLRKQNESSSSSTKQQNAGRTTANAADNAVAAVDVGSDGSVTSVRDANYQLQKEVLLLQEQKATLESQVGRLNEAIASLQLNLTREIQRAREEGERQAVFLRSQLLESKEHATALQEKLVGQFGAAEALRSANLESATTERLLITSDAVLHRLQVEKPLASYRSKFDVTVEFNGRWMVMTGRKLNVQLLKAEILQALNEMYATLTDPTKHAPAAKARESARNVETEHLRRTIATHETTIASLHTAIQHAQDKSLSAVNQCDAAKRDLVVAREKMNNERGMWKVDRAELQAEIDKLRQALSDSEETSRMALASLQQEAALGMETRRENEILRDSLKDSAASKEVAERVAYVATEQSKVTQGTFSELLERAQMVESERRRADVAEREMRSAQDRANALSRELQQRAEREAEERGAFAERLNQALTDVESAKKQWEEAIAERDKLRHDVNASNQLILELRDKHGAGHLSTNGADSLANQVSRINRLEEENSRLRAELQRAFEDMKTVAVTLRETKAARAKALHDVERLEMERTAIAEERQRIEMSAVQERMAFKSRETELMMQAENAKEERDHSKKRIDMLHMEYQKRIQNLLPGGSHQHSAATSSIGEQEENGRKESAARSMSENLAEPNHQPTHRSSSMAEGPRASPMDPLKMSHGQTTTAQASGLNNTPTSSSLANAQQPPRQVGSFNSRFQQLLAEHGMTAPSTNNNVHDMSASALHPADVSGLPTPVSPVSPAASARKR